MTARVIHGDCIAEMRAMAGASVDAIVTDPPYLISFMGKDWDSADGIAGKPDVWREALRVLKPGGHLLAFSGSRTYHRMACAIEDAGFEIRDQIMWLYGSGFPKSLDVSKQLDKMAGAEREVIGSSGYRNPKTTSSMLGRTDPNSPDYDGSTFGVGERLVTTPATPEAVKWQGFGTALKPAHEPIVVARKPLSEKTVAQNVLTHGCGALNIDGCRVSTEFGDDAMRKRNNVASIGFGGSDVAFSSGGNASGRWPANVIHDGSDEVLDAFAAFGTKTSGKPGTMRKGVNDGACYGAESRPAGTPMTGFGDTGSAARFFFCAKASKRERQGSSHPTVKPLALCRYLVKLITPPGGTVLDMFCGTGTTLLAAQMEGFHAVGIEQDAAYVADARKRLGLTFELEAAD